MVPLRVDYPLTQEDRMSFNIKTEVKGTSLVITVDVSEKAIHESGFTSNGRSKLVASSQGVVAIEGLRGLAFGLNVMHKK